MFSSAVTEILNSQCGYRVLLLKPVGCVRIKMEDTARWVYVTDNKNVQNLHEVFET